MIRNVTRDDVAKLAGVSNATVSYVINNGPRNVSEETKSKVLDAINLLGYTPNALARNLRLTQSCTLGLILPDIQNTYFSEVGKGVEQMAYERGYSVLLCHSEYRVEKELQYIETLKSERVAGVLWFPATPNSDIGKKIINFGLPTVVLDRKFSEINTPYIGSDNYKGGHIAAKHLLELGHRRIGLITRPKEHIHSVERTEGFFKGLDEKNIEISKDFIVKGGFSFEDGYRAAKELLEKKYPPTAIFAYNDFMAIGALRTACEMGIKVPEELSIIGFDDLPQAKFTCPSLTTIRQAKYEMGYQGAKMLFQIIENQEERVIYSKDLEVELVIRESTKKLIE